MKNVIPILILLAFMAGNLLISCQSSLGKNESALIKEEVRIDKMTRRQKEISLSLQKTIQQFKMESQQKLNNYELGIAQIKNKISLNEYGNKALNNKKLSDLEQKSNEIQKKLDDFKGVNPKNLNSFKNKLNNEMYALGKEVRDFTNTCN